MRQDLADLSSQVHDLNDGVQGTGRTALVAAKTLLRQRHAVSNVAATAAVVARCRGIVSTVMDAFVHIHEERYYTALNTLDAIQRSLSSLGGIRFAAQLRCWMPSLTEMIDQATKEEMSQWLLDIREASYKIGGAAMRRYAKLQGEPVGGFGARSSQRGGAADVLQQRAAHLTYSVRCLVQLEDLMGCTLRLEDSELEEFVPDFMVMGDRAAEAAEDRVLDHLSEHLHPVHRALHIFARLGMLDDFKAWYVERRRPMAELRSMVTRDLDHLDTEGFLTYLPTLVNGIMGFFIVEDALLRKVDHKEGLLSPSQVEKAWRRCQASLRDLIEHHLSGLSRPGHFMQLKETLLAMAKLASDLDLDCRPLMELLRKLKDPYQKLLLLAFEGECRRILQEESFQPLEIVSEAEVSALRLMTVTSEGLHEGRVRVRGGSEQRHVTPLMPELGFALLKLSGLMVAFLSHVDARSAGAAVFQTMERGTAVVRQVMLELLQNAEADSHILKAAQISANSGYAAKLPPHLASVMYECLAALQFAEDKETSLRSLDSSSRALEGIGDRARDLIFELVRHKADQLLAGMEFVKWEPVAMRQTAHPYCDDLIDYLRVTFMNLSSLTSTMRDAAHFACMLHICDFMLEELLGPRCASVNILGLLNLSRDVAALVAFCEESGIAGLSDCFHKLSQLLDIILANDPDDMVDANRRMQEYPRLDVSHLIAVLEKYKNLSLTAKIKSTVDDEVPQLEQKRVKQILAKLREQV
ncbi:exocyst complex component 6 [Tribonema minus]|uniref:Exocyst complex component 6 n=1 Tax=Tribonema minus TaxID=303371 RepID=A0A835YRQ1_9STRA|nr:exocyst complex component 6 [Tribonema minus]